MVLTATHTVYVQAAPSILDLLLPFVGTVAAILLAGFAGYPFYRNHKEDTDRRNARIDEACDVTLGVDANPNEGRYTTTPGLVHVLPLNGHRLANVPTVMDAAREAKNAAKDAARGVEGLARTVQDHLKADDRRFEELHQRIDAR